MKGLSSGEDRQQGKRYQAGEENFELDDAPRPILKPNFFACEAW